MLELTVFLAGVCTGVLIEFVAIRISTRHTHSWTTWTVWQTVKDRTRRQVYFKRQRFCLECGDTESTVIGKHSCPDSSVLYGQKPCPHAQMYLKVIDFDTRIDSLEEDLGL